MAAKPLKTTVDNIAVVTGLRLGLPGRLRVACAAPDVGYDLSGNAQVKGLTVATYTDTVCLSGDTGTGTTGDFSSDLSSPTAVIAHGHRRWE